MALKMGNNEFVVAFSVLLFIGGVYSVSASSVPARVMSRFFSNAFSVLLKWMGVLFKAFFETAILSRPATKFESGYVVETVFEGSKAGIEPHAVAVLPDGELLILDSANSNLHKISSSLSSYSRPKLVAGSAEGYPGYVDGRLRQARMNHPKGLAVDDAGTIYIADTGNLAIRKISDKGFTTIAGGTHGQGGGYVDGPGEEAQFSDDFDVVYVWRSCSILVVDRGNRAIREIQLHFDDCPSYYYAGGFPSGIPIVMAAVFFGYMLALIQRRICLILSSQDEAKPLTPQNQPHHQYHMQKHSYPQLVHESFVIPDEDGPPPPLKAMDPTPRRTRDSEKKKRLHRRHALYNLLDAEFSQVEEPLYRHQHHASRLQTDHQQSSRAANERVFGGQD